MLLTLESKQKRIDTNFITLPLSIKNVQTMENQNYPTWKHALTYGIYLGVALIILSLLFYVLDMFTQKWTEYVGYVFVLGFIIIASISYRDKHLNGLITYGQSFSVGFFTYLFITFVGDDYKALMLERSEEQIIKSKPDITDEELDIALNFSEKLMRPWWLGVIVFLANLFFSVIFALIVSIFVKKEDDSLTANN